MPSQSRNTAFQPRLCRRCPVRSQLHQNRLWRSAQGAKIFTLSKPLLGVFHNFTFDLFSSFSVFGTDRNVNFQFRLRAGGTHDNRAVIFQQELQHFRLGQPVQAISIIQQLYNLLTAKRFDIAAECLHNALHLGKTGAAVELVAVQGVQAVAIGLVQLVQLIQQADALGGVVAEHLADHVSTVHAVLIADVGAGQVAVAFLKAKYITVCLALLFQLADLLTDKLEAGQHIDSTQTIMGGDLFAHVHCDDGLDHDRVSRHLAVLYALAANVIQQQHTGLVAGQQLVLACLVLDGDAHAVTVRVGGKQQVGVALLGILHAQCHSLFDLRVGIRAGREIAVRLLLLLDHRNVGVAHLLQGAGHGLQTGAVQRTVHDGHILVDFFAKQDGLALDLLYEGGVDLVRDVPDAAVCHASFKAAGPDICKDVQFLDLGQNLRSSLGGDLAAVRAVDLVAVVLAGVVGRRHHDTGRGVQIAGRKGDGRNRHQNRPDVDLDAIGREHARSNLGKHIALDAAVITDGHRRSFKVLFQIVRQTLRGLCHRVDVHPIGACADDAAQTARAKGEVTVECVLDLGIIQRFQFCHNIGIGGGICQPAFVFLFNIHIVYPLTSRNCACPWMVSTSESAGTKMQSPL